MDDNFWGNLYGWYLYVINNVILWLIVILLNINIIYYIIVSVCVYIFFLSIRDSM